MKRFLVILLTMCLILSMTALVATAAATAIWHPRCIVSASHFRAGPSTDTTSYGQFSYGETMLSQSSQSAEWYYGYPDAGTALYDLYGYNRTGYSWAAHFE